MARAALLSTVLALAGCSAAAAPTPQIAFATPAPTTPERVVLDQQGTGTDSLAPFVSTGSFAVAYDYSCSGSTHGFSITADGIKGNFGITLNPTLLMRNDPAGQGTTYGSGPGDISLSIVSLGCSWHVSVTA